MDLSPWKKASLDEHSQGFLVVWFSLVVDVAFLMSVAVASVPLFGSPSFSLCCRFLLLSLFLTLLC